MEPLPTVSIYQSEYGEVRLSEEMVQVFEFHGKMKRVSGLCDSFLMLTHGELERAICTILRLAHEAGVELEKI